MSIYRIYVDSREHKSGTATHSEYPLVYTVRIRERAHIRIAFLCVPNNLLAVQANRNNMICVNELATIGDTEEVCLGYPEVPGGYHIVETLRCAIEATLI